MKRLLVFASLILIVLGLILSGTSDTTIPSANASLPIGEVTSSATEAGNADAANATIPITKYTLIEKKWS